LVTVRLVARCPGEKKMLTGRTDSDCATAAGLVRRTEKTNAYTPPTTEIRDEFREIIDALIGTRLTVNT
jgi:hypothetical protein